MTASVPEWLRDQLAKRQAELSGLADTPDNAQERVTIDWMMERVAVIDQSSSPCLHSTASGSPDSQTCRHPAAVEVRSSVTGELLARLCPDCDSQLPA